MIGAKRGRRMESEGQYPVLKHPQTPPSPTEPFTSSLYAALLKEAPQQTQDHRCTENILDRGNNDTTLLRPPFTVGLPRPTIFFTHGCFVHRSPETPDWTETGQSCACGAALSV